MKKRGKKPVFLVDNDTQFSEFNTKYRKKAKFHSPAGLFGRTNVEDPDIFAKCSSEDIHIITRNSPDFFPQQIHNPTSNIGIIGISSTSVDASIKTFGKMLTEHPYHADYSKKYVSVNAKGYTIKDRRNK